MRRGRETGRWGRVVGSLRCPSGYSLVGGTWVRVLVHVPARIGDLSGVDHTVGDGAMFAWEMAVPVGRRDRVG